MVSLLSLGDVILRLELSTLLKSLPGIPKSRSELQTANLTELPRWATTTIVELTWLANLTLILALQILTLINEKLDVG